MEKFYKKFGLSRELICQIIRLVVDFCDPEKIYLFGSRAREDFKRASDIDIAVEGAKREIVGLKELLEEEVRTLLKFDVVDLSKVNAYLKEEIYREGIVIYEKIQANSQ